jgi:hypothetical protein
LGEIGRVLRADAATVVEVLRLWGVEAGGGEGLDFW